MHFLYVLIVGKSDFRNSINTLKPIFRLKFKHSSGFLLFSVDSRSYFLIFSTYFSNKLCVPSYTYMYQNASLKQIVWVW